LIDVRSILRSLAIRRPVFHSEADFQHEFAWQIRQDHGALSVRLEVPSGLEGVGTTDILVRTERTVLGIELKYLVKSFTTEANGETFRLRTHSAYDHRRYDVLRDVARLERLNQKITGPSYVVVLGNDPAFWKSALGRNTVDAAFRIDHGRTVEGALAWAPHAGLGTTKGRETIALLGRYDFLWEDYVVLDGANGHFRSLIIEIPCADAGV
jgi:hypothetical protein